jgi:hypothetical protein
LDFARQVFDPNLQAAEEDVSIARDCDVQCVFAVCARLRRCVICADEIYWKFVVWRRHGKGHEDHQQSDSHAQECPEVDAVEETRRPSFGSPGSLPHDSPRSQPCPMLAVY